MERIRRPALYPGLVAALAAADADIARNGGFESGLSGWSCTAGSGSVVTTPVHGGSGALKRTPTGNDNAKCSQVITVKPDSAYTLSAWVRGSYVYLGASGTGTTDVSTWTQSAPDWQKLTTSFRTGPSTTSLTVHLNGWYGTPAYYADDLTLVGPGGAPEQPPAGPHRPEDGQRHLDLRGTLLVARHGSHRLRSRDPLARSARSRARSSIPHSARLPRTSSGQW